MNYYQARARVSDGRFDYTCMNDQIVWPVGYCAGYLELKGDEDWLPRVGREEILRAHREQTEPHRAKYHRDGHATAEEASECYRQFLLDQRLVFFPDRARADALHRCEAKGCEVMTSGSAMVDTRRWDLCAAHRTREAVAELMPSVGESVGSV